MVTEYVTGTYEDIIADDHWFETRVWLDGTNYYKEDIYKMSTKIQLFDGAPTIGAAVSGRVNLTINKPSLKIKRMAKIIPQFRAIRILAEDDTQITYEVSPWKRKGEFFIDTRKTIEVMPNGRKAIPVGDGTYMDEDGNPVFEVKKKLEIVGYDAMMKTEKEYKPTRSFPAKAYLVVQDIASAAGMSLEEDTLNALKNDEKEIPDKPEGYTGREILGFIAIMYGGNFLVNDQGELKFLKYYTTNRLIDEKGNYITVGKGSDTVRIYV